MKKPVTWYLLADGAKARIVVRPDAASPYEIIFAEELAAAHLRTRDMGTDRPGRTHESANSGHHAIEPRNDAHRMDEDRFVRMIATHVNHECAQGSFDQLVIYAAPRSLAILRSALSEQVVKTIRGEYPKDLTKMPLAELPAHFEAA